MKIKFFMVCILLAPALVSMVRGEVTDSTFFGFSVKKEMKLDTVPDVVFEHLVMDVGKWWDPEHTYSGNAANLFIQPKPAGCFCEVLPDGGFVQHMTVIYSDPGKILRLSGGLGPLQGLAVQGVLTISLAPDGNGTRAVFSYTVGGYAPGGLQKYAPMVDWVLTQQWERFRLYVWTLAGHADQEESLQK